MFQRMFSNSRKFREEICKDLRTVSDIQDCIESRQKDVPGFKQETYSSSFALVVGAGGLNGEVVEGLVRKGIGTIDIFDGDLVALSNLNRQMFTNKDVGKNKAQRIAKNLSKQGFMGTAIRGYPMHFQEYLNERD